MDDLLTEFLTETSENLAVLDVELVKFEQDSSNNAILSKIFRLVHTIKGTSGFLGLPRLEAVAHAGEDVLGKFRDGDLEVTSEAVTLVQQTIDTIRDLLGGLEEAGSEPEGDDSALIGKLRAMADGEAPVAAEPEEAPAEAPATQPSGPVLNEQGFPVAAELLEEVMAAEASGVKGSSKAEMAAEMETERPEESDSGAGAKASLPAEVKKADSSPAAEGGAK
jgi:two-component system chemotaxis sensor kinase CheA